MESRKQQEHYKNYSVNTCDKIEKAPGRIRLGLKRPMRGPSAREKVTS